MDFLLTVLLYPEGDLLACERVEIRIINVGNDGLRGLSRIEWSIVSLTSTINYTEPAQIQEVQQLQTQNKISLTQVFIQQNNSMTLTIPETSMIQKTEYAINIFLRTNYNTTNIVSFNVRTGSTKGPVANIRGLEALNLKRSN